MNASSCLAWLHGRKSRRGRIPPELAVGEDANTGCPPRFLSCFKISSSLGIRPPDFNPDLRHCLAAEGGGGAIEDLRAVGRLIQTIVVLGSLQKAC
jgi:hypothetical protein